MHEDPSGGPADSSFRAAIGGEFPTPFLDNAWLQISVGATGGRRDADKVFVLATVKFGDGADDLDLTRFKDSLAKLLH